MGATMKPCQFLVLAAILGTVGFGTAAAAGGFQGGVVRIADQQAPAGFPESAYGDQSTFDLLKRRAGEAVQLEVDLRAAQTTVIGGAAIAVGVVIALLWWMSAYTVRMPEWALLLIVPLVVAIMASWSYVPPFGTALVGMPAETLNRVAEHPTLMSDASIREAVPHVIALKRLAEAGPFRLLTGIAQWPVLVTLLGAILAALGTWVITNRRAIDD
jgi:hypothetical protein